MLHTLRSKLIASFLGVSFLVGGVSALAGGQLLYRAFVNEGAERIRMDLNTAREIYQAQVRTMAIAVGTSTLGAGFREDLEAQDRAALRVRVERLARHAGFDFAGVVDPDGRPLCSLEGGVALESAPASRNPAVVLALDREEPVAGTVVIPADVLVEESPELAARAVVPLVATPMASPTDETEEASGMAMVAAMPVRAQGKTLGVLYGGVLLNHSHAIVDKVRDTVFRGGTIDGHPLGTATIFLRDVRIATNVMSKSNKRAVGTRASKDVSELVLRQGKVWSDRAFVVDDWYITAYEPIVDIEGERVGMLYVGTLEARYASVLNKALLVLLALTVLGTALAVGASVVLEGVIMRPIKRLIEAASRVSRGDFEADIGPIQDSDVGVLQSTFAEMLASLRKRDARMKAETDTQLIRYEKQASLGRLAAGVAHEINNPLTGVMTYTHMLLRKKDLDEDVRSDLTTIAEQTERVRRIVKGLLDFSRQTKLDKQPTDIEHLVRSSLDLVENQALVRGVAISFSPGRDLPTITLDRDQMQSVLLNIIINALDATSPGDTITLATSVGPSAPGADDEGVRFVVSDTGSGIPKENIDKLFDPFFTTKEVGRGTGLGLSVSYGIVQRHGGLITVESEVGRGSTFAVWLPSDTSAQGNGKALAADRGETHESAHR